MLAGVSKECSELERGNVLDRRSRRFRLTLLGAAGLHQLDVGGGEPADLTLLPLALQSKKEGLDHLDLRS